MRLLVHESLYIIGINADIENHIKLFNMSEIPANAGKVEIDTP